MKVKEKQKKSKRKAKEKQQHSDRKVKTTKRNVQHPQRKNRKKQSTLRLDVRPQPPTRPPIELCSPYRCTYVYRKRCTNIGVYLFVSFLFCYVLCCCIGSLHTSSLSILGSSIIFHVFYAPCCESFGQNGVADLYRDSTSMADLKSRKIRGGGFIIPF